MGVPARRLASRTIWVDTAAKDNDTAGRAVLYARVSSHDQRADLDRQVARLTQWATPNGYAIGSVVCEVGSGLNGKRPKLQRILSDPTATVIEPRLRTSAVPAEVPETSDQTASTTGGLASLPKPNLSGLAASSEARTYAAEAATELRKEST